MGKKVKKRGKNNHSEKQSPSAHVETSSQQYLSDVDSPVGEIAVVRNRGICPHINRGIALEKLSSEPCSFASPRCEDCRGTIDDRRVKKGKGKSGKKGGIAPNSESKAIWLCLGCGHMSCGGVGLPTIPQSHAVRHAKHRHHPLAVLYENHQQIWCFQCDKLIQAEKIEDAQSKDVLNKAVKILKGCLAKESSINVEDIWFGGGAVSNAVKSDYSDSSRDGKAGYVVRGLINLGNTCFFNSILQNLLAINKLREHFVNLEESVGPITAALRKIFLESEAGSGSRGVMDPKSLLGSLSTKAPQFKGYQQHDSHELLKCLLESLSTEDLCSRKRTQASQSSVRDPTFVDTIFAGALSNTITCSQCGHSSSNHEPFLDLSLPVPTKKTPSKMARVKKQKLPPKKNARNISKINRATSTLRGESFDKSTTVNSVPKVKSVIEQEGFLVAPAGDCTFPASVSPGSIAVDMGLTLDDTSAISKLENNLALESADEITSDNFSWLDYIGPNDISDVKNEQEVKDLSNNSSTLDNFLWLDDIEPNDISDVKYEQEVEDPSNNSSTLDDITELNPVVDEFHVIPLSDVPLALPLCCITKDDTGKLHLATSMDHIEPLTAPPENGFHQFEDKQNVKAELSLFTEDSFADEIGQCDANASSSAVLPEDLDVSEQYIKDPLEIRNSELNQDVASSDDVSAAVLDDKQDSSDFCGFGDLFDEPEESPEIKPSEHSDVSRAAFSSESEPDEVDNEDAPVSIQSCFACFLKPELLSKAEHGWQCDNCSKLLQEQKILKSRKKAEMENGTPDDNPSSSPSRNSRQQDARKVMRDATKTTYINKAPPILTIHLKRFSQDSRGRLSKLNGHVHFGETIELEPYMKNSNAGSIRYELVGVVEHSGNMKFGHYIAYVRGVKRSGEPCWYCANDAHVHEASLQQVLASDAYILFYAKQI